VRENEIAQQLITGSAASHDTKTDFASLVKLPSSFTTPPPPHSLSVFFSSVPWSPGGSALEAAGRFQLCSRQLYTPVPTRPHSCTKHCLLRAERALRHATPRAPPRGHCVLTTMYKTRRRSSYPCIRQGCHVMLWPNALVCFACDKVLSMTWCLHAATQDAQCDVVPRPQQCVWPTNTCCNCTGKASPLHKCARNAGLRLRHSRRTPSLTRAPRRSHLTPRLGSTSSLGVSSHGPEEFLIPALLCLLDSCPDQRAAGVSARLAIHRASTPSEGSPVLPGSNWQGGLVRGGS
jgi:hypothetical protein